MHITIIVQLLTYEYVCALLVLVMYSCHVSKQEQVKWQEQIVCRTCILQIHSCWKNAVFDPANKESEIFHSTCLNLAALMDPLLRGSKSWKCSDTLILLVCTCSCILATNSPTSTSSGGWWGDWGEGSGEPEGRDNNQISSMSTSSGGWWAQDIWLAALCWFVGFVA